MSARQNAGERNVTQRTSYRTILFESSKIVRSFHFRIYRLLRMAPSLNNNPVRVLATRSLEDETTQDSPGFLSMKWTVGERWWHRSK